MVQPHVKVACELDYGREKTFFFVVDENGLPFPNYCDNYHPCDECNKCSVRALNLLIEKAKQKNIFNDPLDR